MGWSILIEMTNESDWTYTFPAGLTVEAETRESALARAEATEAGDFVRLSRTGGRMALAVVPTGQIPASCIRLGYVAPSRYVLGGGGSATSPLADCRG